jgi:hypothetical protein
MLHFTIDSNLDPQSASIRKLLEAHAAYARMSAAKRLSLHLLAIVGAVVWIAALWPALLPAQLRSVALALWGVLLIFMIAASVEEWIWHRKVARYRDEHQGKQKPCAG